MQYKVFNKLLFLLLAIICVKKIWIIILGNQSLIEIVKVARTIEVVIDCLKTMMSMRAGIRGLFCQRSVGYVFCVLQNMFSEVLLLEVRSVTNTRFWWLLQPDFSRFQCVYVLINTQNISSKVKIPRHFLSISGHLVETRNWYVAEKI